MNVWDSVHDARTAFLTCLRAQCLPGQAHGPVPQAGLADDPSLDRAGAVLLSLLDPGLTLATVGRSPVADLVESICSATGARLGPVEAADFVLVTDDAGGLPRPAVSGAQTGTPLAPETGATLVYCQQTARTFATLAGPGLERTTRTPIPLDRRELGALAAANETPPLGVDAFVVTARGALVALPRCLSITLDPGPLPVSAGDR